MADVIDDEWRREKFNDLDVVLPFSVSKTIQMESYADTDNQRGLPISETKEWNDLGMNDLIESKLQPSMP